MFSRITTNLVGGAIGGNIVQFLGINSKTERGLNARTESLCVSWWTHQNRNSRVSYPLLTKRKDTSIVDFSLDKSGLVEVTAINA